MASGYVETGYIRFSTVEPKRFEFVGVRMKGQGTIAVETIDRDGAAASIVSLDLGASGSDYSLNRSTSETILALRFTLTQASTTSGPTLNSW